MKTPKQFGAKSDPDPDPDEVGDWADGGGDWADPNADATPSGFLSSGDFISRRRLTQQ